MAKSNRKNIGGVSFDIDADMSKVDNALNALPKRAARSMQDALRALQAALARNKLDMKAVLANNPNDVLNVAVLKQAQDGLRAKIALVSQAITDQGKAIQDAARQAAAAKQAQLDQQQAAKAAAAAAKQAAQQQAAAARASAKAQADAARQAAQVQVAASRQAAQAARQAAQQQAAAAKVAAQQQAAASRQAAAAAKQAAQQQAAAARQAARAQAGVGMATRASTHRMQVFAQTVDDLQYVSEQGLRPILNNITQIAPKLAIAGIVIQQAIQHWDFFGERANAALSRISPGLSVTKSAVESLAEEMRKLGEITEKTATQVDRLKELEENESRASTVLGGEKQSDADRTEAARKIATELGKDYVIDMIARDPAIIAEAEKKYRAESGAGPEASIYKQVMFPMTGSYNQDRVNQLARGEAKNKLGEYAESDEGIGKLSKIIPEFKGALSENIAKAKADEKAKETADQEKESEEKRKQAELDSTYGDLRGGLESGMRERGEFATDEATVQAALDKMGGVQDPTWAKKLTEDLNTSGSRDLASKALEMGVSQPEAQARIKADIQAQADAKAKQEFDEQVRGKEKFDRDALEQAKKAAPGLGNYLTKTFEAMAMQNIDPSIMKDEMNSIAIERLTSGGMGEDQARRAAELMLAESETDGARSAAEGMMNRKAFQSEKIDLETLGTKLLTGVAEEDQGKKQVELLGKTLSLTEQQVRLLREISQGTPALLG